MHQVSFGAGQKLAESVQSAMPNLMLKLDAAEAGDRFPAMKEHRASADDDDLGAPKGRRNRESAAGNENIEVARVQESAPQQAQAPAQSKEFDVIRI